MAQPVSITFAFSHQKTGYTPSLPSTTVTLDVDEPDGVCGTQDLAADTEETLYLGDVAMPCAAIAVKLITPDTGADVQFSVGTGGAFAAGRFAKLTKANAGFIVPPCLGTAIYVKSVGAAARIFTAAG